MGVNFAIDSDLGNVFLASGAVYRICINSFDFRPQTCRIERRSRCCHSRRFVRIGREYEFTWSRMKTNPVR